MILRVPQDQARTFRIRFPALGVFTLPNAGIRHPGPITPGHRVDARKQFTRSANRSAC
jgi:hypothetical protein